MKERLFRFSSSMELPDYLEDALEPLMWSGIFSKEFKNSIMLVLLSVDMEKSVERFKKALVPIEFLDPKFKFDLIEALEKAAKERANR